MLQRLAAWTLLMVGTFAALTYSFEEEGRFGGTPPRPPAHGLRPY